MARFFKFWVVPIMFKGVILIDTFFFYLSIFSLFWWLSSETNLEKNKNLNSQGTVILSKQFLNRFL